MRGGRRCQFAGSWQRALLVGYWLRASCGVGGGQRRSKETERHSPEELYRNSLEREFGVAGPCDGEDSVVYCVEGDG